jgi:exosortase
MSLLTLGVIFAYFFRETIGERTILVASTIPIAIFVNGLRVALTGVLAHYYGADAATGMIHEFQGLFTFVVAFFVLLGEARLLSALWPQLPQPLRERLA